MTVWNTQLTFQYKCWRKLTDPGQHCSVSQSKDTCWNGCELFFSISSLWQTAIHLNSKWISKWCINFYHPHLALRWKAGSQWEQRQTAEGLVYPWQVCGISWISTKVKMAQLLCSWLGFRLQSWITPKNISDHSWSPAETRPRGFVWNPL